MWHWRVTRTRNNNNNNNNNNNSNNNNNNNSDTVSGVDFSPFETSGVWGEHALDLVTETGRRIAGVTHDPRSTMFLPSTSVGGCTPCNTWCVLETLRTMSCATSINYLNYNDFNELCFVFCWLRLNCVVSITIICLFNYTNTILIIINIASSGRRFLLTIFIFNNNNNNNNNLWKKCNVYCSWTVGRQIRCSISD